MYKNYLDGFKVVKSIDDKLYSSNYQSKSNTHALLYEPYKKVVAPNKALFLFGKLEHAEWFIFPKEIHGKYQHIYNCIYKPSPVPVPPEIAMLYEQYDSFWDKTSDIWTTPTPQHTVFAEEIILLDRVA